MDIEHSHNLDDGPHCELHRDRVGPGDQEEPAEGRGDCEEQGGGDEKPAQCALVNDGLCLKN